VRGQWPGCNGIGQSRTPATRLQAKGVDQFAIWSGFYPSVRQLVADMSLAGGGDAGFETGTEV